MLLSAATWANGPCLKQNGLPCVDANIAQDDAVLMWMLAEGPATLEPVNLPPTFAQVPNEPPPDESSFDRNRKRFGRQMQEMHQQNHQRRKHLEQFRILKLLELLDLDDSQQIDFMQAFTTVRREMGNLDQQKQDVITRLSAGLYDRTVSDEEVYKMVDEIVRIEKEKRTMSERFMNESKRYLTAKQVGKLLIFQERFEYQLLEQVKQFRNRFGRDDSGAVPPDGPPIEPNSNLR